MRRDPLLVRLVHGRTVPVAAARFLRRIGLGPESLVPRSRRTSLDPQLAAALGDTRLGAWALGPMSIAFVTDFVARTRPSLIVEFGSGASTIALAVALRNIARPPQQGPRLISIDQEDEYAARTRVLLGRAGLQDEATVVVAPLVDQVLEGRPTTCYAMTDEIQSLLGDRKAELVVIDGPAGERGIRFGTLPLLRRHLADGANVLMDDALRDGELDIARAWARLPYVQLVGIHMIEKGLLVGRVRSPTTGDDS